MTLEPETVTSNELDSDSDIVTLKNGTLFDKRKGRIIANPNAKNNGFNSDSAKKAAQARATKKLQAQIAARHGLARVSATGTSLDAWSAIVEAQARKAIDTSDKGSTLAARFVQDATGFNDTVTGQDPATGSVTQAVTVALLYRLLDAIERETETRIVIDR